MVQVVTTLWLLKQIDISFTECCSLFCLIFSSSTINSGCFISSNVHLHTISSLPLLTTGTVMEWNYLVHVTTVLQQCLIGSTIQVLRLNYIPFQMMQVKWSILHASQFIVQTKCCLAYMWHIFIN
jgi:hypothetical protein